MTIYTVQQGDWLSKIAIQKGLTVEQLLQANPRLRPNPDLILAGEELNIPLTQTQKRDLRLKQELEQQPTSGPMSREQTPAKTDAAMTLPEPAFSGDKSTTQAQSEPLCQAKLYEIVHITGEGAGGFYVLNEAQSDALREEITTNEALMKEYAELCKNAPDDAASDSARLTHVNTKKDWLIKAAERQLIPIKEPKPEEEQSYTDETQELNNQLQRLEKLRLAVQDYLPLAIFRDGNAQEVNWSRLRTKVLIQLDHSIAVKERRLADYSSGQPKKVSDASNQAPPEVKVRTSDLKSPKTATKARVVELIVFSQSDRWRYVSAAFLEQTQLKAQWLKVSNSSKIKQIIASSQNGAPQAVAKELLDHIREDVNKSKENFKAELKQCEAKTDGDAVFSVLYKELFNVSTNVDRDPSDSVFAADADAQLLRFAAVASTGATNFDPREGPIEIGGKAKASFALLEGRVNASLSLPSAAGYTCAITYRDGDGQEVRHSFGAYRLQGELALSCFVGAKVEVEVEAKASVGDAAQAAYYHAANPGEAIGSASALLAPAIEMGINPSGGVGFKGEAFAGGQAGGQLSGSLEWKAPLRPKQEEAAPEPQEEEAPDWSSLMEMKAEGNLALGIGAGLDFGLRMERTDLIFYCHGRLVFGPGAAGGIGGKVDGDKILDLVVMVCDVLTEVDYRYLLNVDREVFENFYLGLLKAFTEPGETLKKVFDSSLSELSRWGEFRQLQKENARELARNINVNKYEVRLKQLPPETLGMMLHTLSETFVEVREEQQETAIIKLLENVQTWRHFIKALEHMSVTGENSNPLHSLDRLNAILDGTQQREFNNWIARLKDEGQPPRVAPYTLVKISEKLGLVEKQMLACRRGNQTTDTRVV
ncbi:MAG: LysM repeat protein [Motiliproteus sp.]|jgi:LysM repeat protein